MKKFLVLLCVVGLVSGANATIVANGGFELGTGIVADNWGTVVLGDSSVERVTDSPYAGEYSIHSMVDYESGTGTKAEILQQTATGSVVAGTEYDFSFMAKGNAGPGVVAFYDVQWLDSDGSDGGGVKGSIGLTGFQGALTGAYQSFGGTGFVAPAGADCAFISIRLEGGAFVGSTGDMFIDDVVLSRVIPEPATMALLGLGGLFLRRRK